MSRKCLFSPRKEVTSWTKICLNMLIIHPPHPQPSHTHTNTCRIEKLKPPIDDAECCRLLYLQENTLPVKKKSTEPHWIYNIDQTGNRKQSPFHILMIDWPAVFCTATPSAVSFFVLLIAGKNSKNKDDLYLIKRPPLLLEAAELVVALLLPLLNIKRLSL